MTWHYLFLQLQAGCAQVFLSEEHSAPHRKPDLENALAMLSIGFKTPLRACAAKSPRTLSSDHEPKPMICESDERNAAVQSPQVVNHVDCRVLLLPDSSLAGTTERHWALQQRHEALQHEARVLVAQHHAIHAQVPMIHVGVGECDDDNDEENGARQAPPVSRDEEDERGCAVSGANVSGGEGGGKGLLNDQQDETDQKFDAARDEDQMLQRERCRVLKSIAQAMPQTTSLAPLHCPTLFQPPTTVDNHVQMQIEALATQDETVLRRPSTPRYETL